MCFFFLSFCCISVCLSPLSDTFPATSSYSTDEMKQMRVNLRLMKQETINEKKLLNDFQQQKEKIEKFWTMEKKKRDDLKMLFRNKLRQKQDLEEKHAFELKVHAHLFHLILSVLSQTPNTQTTIGLQTKSKTPSARATFTHDGCSLRW